MSDEPEIRYKNVEEVLCRIFEVPLEDAGAFRARLRHLRNMGVPKLPKPGSGKQIGYTRDQLVEMLIALELLALGIAPKRVLEALSEEALTEKAVLALPPHLRADREPDQVYPSGVILLGKARFDFAHLKRLVKRIEGYSVFLIVHPGAEFASGERYKIEIQELTKDSIGKLVEDEQRVCLVNLSHSFDILDEYFEKLN